jgi:pyridoxine 4-dehydrogenase
LAALKIDWQTARMSAETITADAAGTWTLGEKTVNRLGFGAMRLTQDGKAFSADAAPSDRDRALAVLRRAAELGVNHIDTAAFYFSRLRSANELINRALAPYPDDLVIATKVGPSRHSSGEWGPLSRPEQLRGQVEENLRQLGRDHLDLVYLRRRPGEDSIAEHFGALAALRDAGLIRHLGISGVTPAHLAEAQTIAPVVSVQNNFGLGAAAEAREVLRACAEAGVAFVPYFAIAGRGGHAGPGTSDGEEIKSVARAHDATPAQIRLAWTLQQGPHVLAIPGTGNPDHLAANVAAAAISLSADELATLDAAGAAAR